jgi:signal transduction histidine kinase
MRACPGVDFAVSQADRALADLLDRERISIATRWQQQARAVAPRGPARAAEGVPDRVTDILVALATAMRGERPGQDEVMRAGWEYGADAHLSGRSLHYLLKELDLLSAITLYAFQRALEEAGTAFSAADGIGAARQWQKCCSLLTLSASKGFTHAYLKDLQAHYRELRHDLRNPLGTIKSAVSLMEDETVPEVMRNDPRFRAMVVRNAKFMDTVIGEQLSDASTLVPAFARQEVSLRDVAWSVGRDARDDAREAGCEIEISDALPTVLTDSTGFELALKSVVAAALQRARSGSTIAIGLRELHAQSAVVAVSFESGAPTDDLADNGALEFAREVSTRCGGRTWREDAGTVCLDVPVSVAHAGHDVAGVREG